MLLQIEEPGEIKTPQHTCVVGIDLGTTNSVIAYVKEGKPYTLSLRGSKLTPSIISIEGEEVTVGKRLGHSFSSTKRHFDKPDHPFEGTAETPCSLAAMILRFMKNEAEKELDQTIDGAVITVPAYFDEPARQATKRAAERAGLNVLRLINEPTAAAVAYHLEHQNEGLYLIYDLGGGTFDVSLLRLAGGVFQILGVGGDTKLGGDDVDQMIQNYLQEKGISITLLEARNIKENIDAQTHLSKAQLLEITESFVQKTMMLCADVLKEANVTKNEIQGIVMVGGSTRLWGLKGKLNEFFGKEVLDNINPDEVVAHGAALQAHGLTYGSDRLLLDVNPLSLGIETMGGLFEKIIPRNTPLPCHMAQNFTTYVDGQTMMDIHILQGERDMVADCRSLGRFVLSGIPPLPKNTAKIRIAFKMDVDGLLVVEATELSSGTTKHIEVKPQHALLEEDMHKMILESVAHSREDMEARLLAYAKNEGEQILLEVEKAIHELGVDVVTESLTHAIESLKSSLNTEDRQAIKACSDALSVLSEPLALKKIQRALEESLEESPSSQVS